MKLNTMLFGLMGENTQHSLSPLIHNTAFRALGINAHYICFEINNRHLAQAINAIRTLDIKGINVTIPHKIQIIKHLDVIDENAEKIGAVNTIINKNNLLVGFNTDETGAVKAIETEISITGKTVTVIGCGGAGRAIVFGISKKAKKINLLNRTLESAKKFADEINSKKIKVIEFNNKNLKTALDESEILINATSVGMNSDKSPVPKQMLNSELFVSDIVYTPLETRLIRNAKEMKCRTLTGENMLVMQAAESFKLMTGKKAPLEIMQQTVKDELKVNK